MPDARVTGPADLFSALGIVDPAGARTDRELLELIVANLNDAVLITEGEASAPVGRRILFVNRAFTRLTGFTAAEARERTPDLTVGPETDRGALARIQAARRDLVPIREELIKYRKDGSTFWAELEVIPVLRADGRCSHYLGVMRDISERKALATRLLEADRMATIGALVAGIAHEINNPLTSVLTNIDFLGQQVESPELGQALDEARIAADRVRGIIADLKSFSRADDSSRVPLDPRKVLDASLQLARTAIRSRAKVVQTATGESLVLASEARLGQAFLNLILNAAQAIPDSGGPHVIATNVRTEGERTIIEVADTGIGILPEIRHRIFDPFFTTSAVERKGLGLWITRDIVTSLGGSLAVEDNVPRGTVMRISLPSVRGAVEKPAPPAAKARGRVMLIDDDVAVGKALFRLLSTR
ncbi:MAG: PAS domain S-box protein, partial [Myxococcales bacterium]|nr:PAS domain S-box protein [Myxococcales bacterium]